MDVLYEESALNQQSNRGRILHKILKLLFCVFISLGGIAAFMTIATIPLGEGATWELFIVALGIFLAFAASAAITFLVMRRLNVSFDYTFVSGELRISKVFNVNKRKRIYTLDAKNIIQLGDVDSPSYDFLVSDPTLKRVVCTSNQEPSEGKFFLYIDYADEDGRAVYILECREALLINLLRFSKRSAPANDYVSKAKKGE
ncbi:MAG: hypothetical protein IJV80_04165 [Clostridia bacterium]|nr:hypothetical protein [Clostridia bacterium]